MKKNSGYYSEIARKLQSPWHYLIVIIGFSLILISNIIEIIISKKPYDLGKLLVFISMIILFSVFFTKRKTQKSYREIMSPHDQWLVVIGITLIIGSILITPTISIGNLLIFKNWMIIFQFIVPPLVGISLGIFAIDKTLLTLQTKTNEKIQLLEEEIAELKLQLQKK